MTFSILIPAYKAAYLKEAVASCLAQTYADLEVIVVDDASPEDLPAQLADFRDERLQYFRNDVNCGALHVVDNWNICLNHASGEYVICMGDDDRLTPECLQQYAQLIAQHPGLGLYHTRTRIIAADGSELCLQEERPETESACEMAMARWNGRTRQYIGDFLFRRDMLLADGGFHDLPLAWGSDDISAFKAAVRGGGVANTNAIGFEYRSSGENISSSGRYEDKVEAALQEGLWYAAWLFSASSEEDKRMAQMLPMHMREKVMDLIFRDMKVSRGHVCKWMKERKRLGLSVKDVVYEYLRAIVK